jgi:hypothetical protein
MRNRVLSAACALAFVPALLLAQQRPAPGPAQRPAAGRAAPAAMGHTFEQQGAFRLSLTPSVFIERDKALFDYLYRRVAVVTAKPDRYLPGGTAGLAYQISPSLAFGARLGVGFTNGLTLLQPQVGLTYTLMPAKRLSPYLGVDGGGSRIMGSGAISHVTGVGGYVSAGIRNFFQDNMAGRIEARLGFENYSDESINAIVGSVGIGVAYYLGGGPPKDTDADGVPDKMDRCPGTPQGAVVDARGCPVDSDHDGVADGLDRCADTPSGVRVDANGCPVDSDSDGVADNVDRCPNTPSGVHVDANGCPVDADGDGVADYQDRCPDTPRGAPVDANGCPKDSDGDGVADYLDHCPDTPSGATVDANGCPIDSDHDGVADYMDRCPNTAPGTQVDANGCPVEKDTDGDGVVDSRDRCASTPSGVQVYREGTYAGCPVHALPAAGAAAQVVRGVSFRTVRRQQQLTPASRPVLDTIAETMKATPGARWEIGGYTDITGTLAGNNRLSQQRAQAATDYLVSRGVDAASLTVVGYGPQRPIASNRTARGRARNRRIEIKRLQ